MNFSRRKLGLDASEYLVKVSVESVNPFELMLAPVYVFLKENEKFVSLKAPLDFFTPAELERFKRYENFFFPDCVGAMIPYRQAGQLVKEILTAEGELPPANPDELYPVVMLPPSPYEVSDAVLREIGTLWWDHKKKGPGVEPFLVCAFVNELCNPLPEEKLLHARETSIEAYERGLLYSSWVVFLALHLGYSEFEFINRLRLRIFDENVQSSSVPLLLNHRNEIDELISVAYQSFSHIDLSWISVRTFEKIKERVSHRLASRLKRVCGEFLSRGVHPTIYGERGFIHD